MTEGWLALQETVAARLEALGEQLSTIELSPRSTIIPTDLGDTAGERALSLLKDDRGQRGGLTLQGTIGQGGMGVVRSGTQVSLGRSVAIKTLRDDRRSARDVLTLLREAWVTGALEHPNILPIYDVKVDEKNMPMVVLKRIEGVDWADILNDPLAMADRVGEGDLLERNLDVLMQVCRAVAFAHNCGIVHRDIKPENVRIGSFGEVYLLDWGIAVALSDDGTGRFPLAKNATAMAGTPTYMAPEMLGDSDLPSICAQTDIYLLGATLYEVAVGRPPHDKPTLAAVVSSVLRPNLDFDGVPEELADIIRRAMAADPQERFESADALRNAVARFLAHRGADKLVANAMRRLAELEAIATEASESARVTVHERLGACRAGFSAALEVQSGNSSAQDGLRRAIEVAADYELQRGDARAATDLLTQVETPSQALVDRVAVGLEQQRAEEARRDELEALGKDLDPETGARTRAFAAIVFGLLSIIMPTVMVLKVRRETYTSHLVTTTGAMVVGLALFIWARESLTKTAYNRRMAGTIMLTLLATYAATFGAMLLQLPPSTATAFYMLSWAAIGAMASATAERRLWPTAAGYLAGFIGAAAFPEHRFIFLGAGNLVLTVTCAILWGIPGLRQYQDLRRERARKAIADHPDAEDGPAE